MANFSFVQFPSAMIVVGLMAITSMAQEKSPTPKPDTLGPGDHTRTNTIGDLKRNYRVHIPPQYDSKKPTPVVLGALQK